MVLSIAFSAASWVAWPAWKEWVLSNFESKPESSSDDWRYLRSQCWVMGLFWESMNRGQKDCPLTFLSSHRASTRQWFVCFVAVAESVGYYQHYVVRNELNIVPSNCFFNLLAVQGMLIVDTNSNFIGTWSRRHEAVAEVIWWPEVDIVDKFVQNHFSYGHQFFLSVLILIPNAQLGLGNCCIHAGWLMSHSYWDFATLIDQQLMVLR